MKFERSTQEHASDETAKLKSKQGSSPAKNAETVSMSESERQEALEVVRRKHEDLIEHAKEVAADEGPKRKPTSEEIKEAKEIIGEYLSAGEYPRITLSREHLKDVLEKGLKARPTAYQKDVKLLVGTLGREAFLPEEQDRVILEIHVDAGKVTPRFTGEAKAFEGIVGINADEVPPSALRVIDPKGEAPDAEENAA